MTQTLDELACLVKQVEAHGFEILRSEEGFQFTDGSWGPIAIRPKDPEKLLKNAQLALARERNARFRAGR